MKTTFRLLLGSFCLVALLGCGGGKMAEVEGTVTLDGSPLEGATVSFQPDHEGRPSTGTTDASGHYELRYTLQEMGAEVGTHTVRINAMVTKSDKFGEEKILGNKIPPQYNTNTELKKEVESGSNEINFDLKGGGKIYPAEGGGQGGNNNPDTCE